jgi:hypothetical protein
MAVDYQKEIENLAEELGFGAVSEEKKLELIAQMGEVLIKRIMLETFDRLGEAGVDEYEKIMESGGDEIRMKALLDERIPGYDMVVEKIVANFKDEMKKESGV